MRSDTEKGLFIGFDGLPGCGKTTIIRALLQILFAEGLAAIAVDTDTSKDAPALRAAADALPLDNLVRSMIFWEMRRKQYEIIEAMRLRMDVVFADRTWLGTPYAYDVYGNGIPRELLDPLGKNLWAPDITFLLEIPWQAAQKRKASRTIQDGAFACRVEQGYAKLARIHGWIGVDATQAPEEITEQCLGIIRRALAQKVCRV